MEFVSDNCIRSASGRCDRAITDCLTDRRLVDWGRYAKVKRNYC